MSTSFISALFDVISNDLNNEGDNFGSILKTVTVAARHTSHIIDTIPIENDELIHTKSATKSLMYRTTGNKEYIENDLLKALLSYDNSIANAPKNSPELAMGFANRSAVLQKMGKLNECIVDIHRALHYGYPENLKFKLLLREAQCLRDLNGHSEQAVDCFDSALEALKKSDLSEQKKQKTERLINEQKNIEKQDVKETYNAYVPTKLPPVSYGPSKEVPCASSALGLRYNDTFGRYYEATRDIKIGDILIVEKPFAAKLLTAKNLPVCDQCYKICFTLLPCPNCSLVMFCSEECVTQATENYHLIECPIVSRFILLDPEIDFLGALHVIRCIAKVGIDNIKNYLDLIPSTPPLSNESKRTRGFNSNGIYDASDFLTILNLETNFSKISHDTRVLYCIASLFIAKVYNQLESIDFIAMIYQIIASLYLNGIGIQCATYQKDTIECYYDIRLGSGIYPCSSFLSHSCNPNTISTFLGSSLVIRALGPIPKGKPVTLSYGCTFIENNLIERRETLKEKYFFECNCEACKGNWKNVNFLHRLSSTDINRLPYEFGCKLLKARSEISISILSTVEEFLKNEKSLQEYVDKSINEISPIVNELRTKNEMVNLDFVLFNYRLMNLIVSSGNVITDIKK